MPTTLSIEAKLQAGLRLRCMSVEEFAKLAKLDGITAASRSQLNKAFQKENPTPLSNDVALKLLAIWGEIESMIFECLPFPLDLSDGDRVHVSLQIHRGLQALKGDDNNSNKETQETSEG